MTIQELLNSDQNIQEWKPSASWCRDRKKSGKPMGASQKASCKAQGVVARDTGKTQLNKTTGKREKLAGKRARSEKYGGSVSSTRTG